MELAYKAYQTVVFNTVTGKIINKAKIVIALDDQQARDEVVRTLSRDLDLSEVQVVVVPLG